MKVYLALEFQSTIDPLMPLRLFTYTGLLYQDLARQDRFYHKKYLPPIFTVVFYNGSRPWTAPGSLAEMQPELPQSLRRWQLEFRFFLVDESTFTAEDMVQRDNLVASLIQIDISTEERHLLLALSSFLIKAKKRRIL